MPVPPGRDGAGKRSSTPSAAAAAADKPVCHHVRRRLGRATDAGTARLRPAMTASVGQRAPGPREAALRL